MPRPSRRRWATPSAGGCDVSQPSETPPARSLGAATEMHMPPRRPAYQTSRSHLQPRTTAVDISCVAFCRQPNPYRKPRSLPCNASVFLLVWRRTAPRGVCAAPRLGNALLPGCGSGREHPCAPDDHGTACRPACARGERDRGLSCERSLAPDIASQPGRPAARIKPGERHGLTGSVRVADDFGRPRTPRSDPS